MGRNTRRPEIQRRRRRRAKIKKLKAKIAKTSNAQQLQALVGKIRLVSPSYPVQQAAPPKRKMAA